MSRYLALSGPWAMLLLVLLYVGLAAGVSLFGPAFSRTVVAVDRHSGELLWQTTVAKSRLKGTLHRENTPASSTPVSDGDHVYADFGQAGSYCLDFDGRIVWKHQARMPRMKWGPASSPVLWRDLLILTHDTDERSYTVALEKATGEIRWEAERDLRGTFGYSFVDAYGTPAIVETETGDQLVHYAARYVAGYDPATGDELWRIGAAGENDGQFEPAPQVVASPVAARGRIVLAGSCYLNPRQMAALHMEKQGGVIRPTVDWVTSQSAPDCSSPVVHGDHVYGVTRNGVATCRELESGELVWRNRLTGDYYASVVATADGRVFFSSLDGETTVVQGHPQLNILERNALDEPIYASPAISGGELFIRTTGHLYCIGSTPPTGMVTLQF